MPVPACGYRAIHLGWTIFQPWNAEPFGLICFWKTAKEMAMDFMEMREALSVAGCIAANSNQDFYGARPSAASRAMAGASSIETISRHAASAVCIGYDPRIAPGSIQPN
ncbi:MAG TPA: hypothetical protein VGT79_02255 [Xanthomonadaceae bacterium]|nr:hypothetical protein [Xanthomonadaceae bacterium]